MEMRSGEARYRLLLVVRHYAAERLAALPDETALRERHAAFFLALAEESEEHMLGYGAPRWAAALDDETANLRAAFDWCLADPDRVDAALRLGRVMYWFWRATGQVAEGRARLAAALAHSERADPRARARAMTAFGFLTFCQGDRGAVRRPMAESVETLRHLDDPDALASAMLCLGMADLLVGDVDQAAGLLEEAVETARRTGRPGLMAQTLYWLGNVAHARGDLAGACEALEEAVRLTRGPETEFARAHCSARLGLFRNLAGDQAGALAALAEALVIHRRAGDRWGAVQVLDGLAGVATALGRAESAARLLGAAEAISRVMDSTAPLDLRQFHDQFVAATRAAIGEAAYERARAGGLTLDVEGALAAAEGIVAQTLSRAGPVPDRPAQADAPLLCVRALGPLEIRLEGRPIPPSAWRAARPRELLLYLLSHRGGRTRDQIALAFWPRSRTTSTWRCTISAAPWGGRISLCSTASATGCNGNSAWSLMPQRSRPRCVRRCRSRSLRSVRHCAPRWPGTRAIFWQTVRRANGTTSCATTSGACARMAGWPWVRTKSPALGSRRHRRPTASCLPWTGLMRRPHAGSCAVLPDRGTAARRSGNSPGWCARSGRS
jgi:tetratricopeptide (TPR) repeat protein